MFNFNNFKEKAKDVENWLTKELSSIRTGRASVSILDAIHVNAYGSNVAINTVASISIEDPRTIRIEPWDKTQNKEIEKALVNSNLGLSVNTDDKGLRIVFPELTGERREQFIKLAGTKLEESRISLRSAREEVVKEIEAKEKEGGMGEDDKFRLKEDLQKLVDESNKRLEEMLEKKKKEING